MTGRGRAGIGAAIAATALACPAVAGAHGLVQRANLAIPEWLFGTAAAVVLVVSFLALGLLWSKPRIEGSNGWRPLPGLGPVLGSPVLETVCQVAGALLLIVVIAAGFAGVQQADDNLAPT